MLLGTMVGLGGGPWLIAIFTDYVLADPMMISRSIAVVSTSLMTVAGLILWRDCVPCRERAISGLTLMRQDRREMKSESPAEEFLQRLGPDCRR